MSKKYIKIVKVDDDSFDHVRNTLKSEMELQELQTYFPILSLFFNFYNGSKKSFTLKSRYKIDEIVSRIDHKIDDSYIKNFFKCKITDIQQQKNIEKDIFIKTLPILNVMHFLMNEYNLSHPSNLPNIHSNITQKKN